MQNGGESRCQCALSDADKVLRTRENFDGAIQLAYAQPPVCIHILDPICRAAFPVTDAVSGLKRRHSSLHSQFQDGEQIAGFRAIRLDNQYSILQVRVDA